MFTASDSIIRTYHMHRCSNTV